MTAIQTYIIYVTVLSSIQNNVDCALRRVITGNFLVSCLMTINELCVRKKLGKEHHPQLHAKRELSRVLYCQIIVVVSTIKTSIVLPSLFISVSISCIYNPQIRSVVNCLNLATHTWLQRVCNSASEFDLRIECNADTMFIHDRG